MSNLIYINEKGFVLPVGLMFLAIISILGTTAVTITTTDLKIGRNYKTSVQAFYAGEAGIQRATHILKAGASNGFDNELLGTDGKSNTSDDGILNFGDESSAVQIIDNNDGDGDLFSDSDNKVIITSTGTASNASKTIEAIFSYQAVDVDGALGLYGDGPAVDLGNGPSEIDGRDHNVPTSFNCSGVHCEGTLVSGAPAETGIYAENTLIRTGIIDGPAKGKGAKSQNVFGDPPIDDEGGGVGSVSYWQDFANGLIPAQTIDAADGTFAGNVSIGTRENPQVTVITDDKCVGTHLSGTVDGAGILVINGDLQITGTFHFEGLVIVISDEDLVVTGTGRSILFGSIVLAGSGNSSEVDYGGHASIRYSSDALSYAAATLAKLDAWREL